MKVRIIKDDDHRIKPAVFQAFREGAELNLPKATAKALIARGSATSLETEQKD